MLQLVDTHCHIHDSEFAHKYDVSQAELLKRAAEAGVSTLICVGTDTKSSREAVDFVAERDNCYASLALHPHEAAVHDLDKLLTEVAAFEQLLDLNYGKIVAIGECGLDYYYHQSEQVKSMQKHLFRSHIELALKYQLPMIFHIRDAQKQDESLVGNAFTDFFDILDEYTGVTGVVHSFSAGKLELEGCIARGLYIGLNGIMTFSKQKDQLDAAKMVPLDRIVLETDAPFLTPAPFRGKMCEPKHVHVTAKFLSELRGESLIQLAETTTRNAHKLFGIK